MFYCNICNYSTKNRSMIHSHHIISKFQRGSNKKNNRVYLCPTCHSSVFIPSDNINTIVGVHAIFTEDSIIIHGWKMSSSGRLLHYSRYGEEYFTENKN